MSTALLAMALCLMSGVASAQHGLQWGAPVADRTVELALAGWKVGLRVHLMDSSQAPLRLLGDHHLTGPGFGGGLRGGLRVSGGLAFDPGRRPAAEGLALSPAVMQALPPAAPRASWQVQPYVGVGYTLAGPSGWGFAADLGLGGQRDDGGLRLGPAARSGGFEPVLGHLRLAPVLQLGVSYAF